MKNTRILFLGILIVSVILRCIHIDTRGIQYDDAFSILLAEKDLPSIINGTAADTMPPLYYFILHFWMLPGHQIWFIRLLSVGYSTGCIVLLYLIVRELFDGKAALWASALMAVSPLQIYHAQDIRMYAQLAFFQLAYYWFFIRIKANENGLKRPINWIGFIMSGVFAMYTHNLAIFGLCAPLLYLLLAKKWKVLARVIAANIILGLLVLPWMVMIPGQIKKIQDAFWTPKPGLVEIFQAIIMAVGTLPLPWFWMVITAVISIQIVVLIIVFLRKKSNWTENILIMVCFTVIPPSLLFITSYIMRPVFVPRGFLVSASAFLGLTGIIIGNKNSKGAGVLLPILFGLAACISLPYQIQFDQFPRSQFKEAASYLKSNISDTALIVHDNKLSYFPMVIYDRDLPQEFIADTPGSANDTLAYETQKSLNLYPQKNIDVAVDNKNEVYFVVFAKTIEEYRTMGKNEHPVIQWMDEKYSSTDVKEFGDLRIFHFLR